jgi:hypothetical protein
MKAYGVLKWREACKYPQAAVRNGMAATMATATRALKRHECPPFARLLQGFAPAPSSPAELSASCSGCRDGRRRAAPPRGTPATRSPGGIRGMRALIAPHCAARHRRPSPDPAAVGPAGSGHRRRHHGHGPARTHARSKRTPQSNPIDLARSTRAADAPGKRTRSHAPRPATAPTCRCPRPRRKGATRHRISWGPGMSGGQRQERGPPRCASRWLCSPFGVACAPSRPEPGGPGPRRSFP